ncbi:MAG: alpha/beta hydrolase [Geminicoccaceae bacterium]|nr:alpha/beta hydrolase [Geminicoccaceae bacterium]
MTAHDTRGEASGDGPASHTLELDGDHAGTSIHWLERGPADADQVIVCVHGLTRNAHDFDILAASLARSGARVLSIDVVGRGGSSWLEDPQGYAVPVYTAQLIAFLRKLGLSSVDWIGTSMGGLIGMGVAVTDPAIIGRLVLNDIGPFVPKRALAEIRTYLGLELTFGDLDELEAHLRFIHASFGQLTDEQWRHMAVHSSREVEGGWKLNYDPAIREAYDEVGEADIEIWELFEAITCPVFLIYGRDSRLLDAATVERMKTTGPGAQTAGFAGVGHAPALMSDDQIATISGWLGAPLSGD